MSMPNMAVMPGMPNAPANGMPMNGMPAQMPGFVDPEAEFEAGRAHEPTPAPTPGAAGARAGAPPGPAAGLNSFPHGRGGGGGGGAEGAPPHHPAGPMMMHPDFAGGENGSAVTSATPIWTTATIRPMVPDVIVQRYPTIEVVANESATNVQSNVVSGAASASPSSAWVKINITNPKSQVMSVR